MISIAAPQADAPLCTMRKACDFSLVSSACRDQQIEVGPTTKELAEKGFIVVEKDEPRTVRLTPRGYALVGLVRSNPASVAFILSDSAEELTPEEQNVIIEYQGAKVTSFERYDETSDIFIVMITYLCKTEGCETTIRSNYVWEESTKWDSLVLKCENCVHEYRMFKGLLR